MNIALLGFGTVGSHFYKLCEGRTDLHVAAVLSRRPRPELTCTVTADYDEIVRDPSIDIVVEVMGGIEPAYSYLCAAMRAGKHVVTANKQLMCAHFEELTSLAKEKGVALRCTAAAGGGIPWLTSLSRASELDEIKAVEGILNGTTNYMLSAMTNSGADYAPALRKAQELGYAEADPTADVEGLDARRKIVLSADLAFGVNIREEDIPCVGISSITAGDIAKAKDEGLTYKLIARAEKNGRAVAAFVCPTLFPSSAPDHPGTMIMESIGDEMDEGGFITGIAGKKGFSIITIAKTGMSSEPGSLLKILNVLAKHEVNVEYLPSGIDNVSLVVSSDKVSRSLYEMLGELQKEVQPNKITVTEHIAIVAAVGRKMAYRPGVSGKIFAKLGENGVNIRMITQGPEELNIIVGVEEKDFEQAIRVLYKSFVKENVV